MKTKFLIYFIFLAGSCMAQNGFSITGKIKGISTGFIYLIYNSGIGISVKDSSKITTTGKFSFKGTIQHPVRAGITIYSESVDMFDVNFGEFFISPGNIKVFLEKDKFKEVVVKGSFVQNEEKQFAKYKADITKRMKPLTDAYGKEEDLEKAAEIRKKMEPLYIESRNADYRYFKEHPSSYLTAYTLRFHVSEMTAQQLEEFYLAFNEEIRQSSYGIVLKDELEKLKAGSPGAVAKDFAKPGINGDTIRLSDYKAKKYVLLDFWASWCIPCRKANPHLKEAYTKYKGKGLEIIGVSDDDRNPEKWKKAVEEDALPWPQILRGLDWEAIRKDPKNKNSINDQYGIHVLPTKLLIDKNGVISGRYSEDENDKLDAKLMELFGR